MIDITTIRFENLYVFYAYPIIFLILLFLTWRNFVHEKKRFSFFKRLLLFISRNIIVILLLAAMSKPYTYHETVEQGDPRVVIVYDNSSSMVVYDTNFVQDLKQKLQPEIQVKMDNVGSKSEIADAILRNLDTRSILLVSDGNNYRGSNLDDAVLFASNSNISISAISLKQKAIDASVSILGPSETIEGIDNNFNIILNKVGVGSVRVTLTIDDQSAYDQATSESEISVGRQFSVGEHKLVAKIYSDDTYTENNVFYKTVVAYEKPKILLLSPDPQLQNVFSRLYSIDMKNELPEKLDEYLVTIIDNMPATFTNDEVNRIYDYLNDGNGLVVVGGKDSLEYGKYEGSYLEPLLPIKVGTAEKKQSDDVNVVVLIDTSGSTGFYGLISNTSGMDIEKAYAVEIVKSMKSSNMIGIISFNEKPYLVSDMVLGTNKDNLIDKISRVNYCGKNCGTSMYETIKMSISMLDKTAGSKNIIVISDGQAGDFYKTLELIKQAKAKGIITYGINIAEPNAIWGNMQELANTGGGQYFRPKDAEGLTLIFGKDDNKKEQPLKQLMVRDDSHFITKNLVIDATVSGYNQVVPKTNSLHLVSTIYGDPILVVGRIGLGRTAVLATDDGKNWAGNLFSKDNSKLVARTVNWAIGNPNKKKKEYVVIKDAYLNQNVDILVKSESVPVLGNLTFSKVDNNLYKSSIIGNNPGFNRILGRDYAVNYDEELLAIGTNDNLKRAVKMTHGKFFGQDDIEGIKEKVKLNSKRVINDKIYYSFYIILTAMAMLLLDITVRRIGVYLKK